MQRLARWEAWRTCVGSARRSRDDGRRPVAHEAVLRAHACAKVLPVVHVEGYDDLRALLALLQLCHRGIVQRRHCVALAILSLGDCHPPIPDLQAEALVGACTCCISIAMCMAVSGACFAPVRITESSCLYVSLSALIKFQFHHAHPAFSQGLCGAHQAHQITAVKNLSCSVLSIYDAAERMQQLRNSTLTRTDSAESFLQSAGTSCA